jgi:hypothetical protein
VLTFLVFCRWPIRVALWARLGLALAEISVRADGTGGPTILSAPSNGPASVQDSSGIRPDHLWTLDYVELLWSDTGGMAETASTSLATQGRV